MRSRRSAIIESVHNAPEVLFANLLLKSAIVASAAGVQRVRRPRRGCLWRSPLLIALGGHRGQALLEIHNRFILSLPVVCSLDAWVPTFQLLEVRIRLNSFLKSAWSRLLRQARAEAASRPRKAMVVVAVPAAAVRDPIAQETISFNSDSDRASFSASSRAAFSWASLRRSINSEADSSNTEQSAPATAAPVALTRVRLQKSGAARGLLFLQC